MHIPKEDYLLLVDEYIDSKSMAWTKNSQKSERARLRSVDPKFLENPDGLYRQLSARKKPYTIKTTFIRIREFAKWMKLEDCFGRFMQDNARLFKQSIVYNRKRVALTYKEALKRIRKMKNPRFRNKALELLATGARWSESFTMDEHNVIIGKGNKRRRLFLPEKFKAQEGTVVTASDYSSFRRALKAVGIKGPHTLRKLAANRLIEIGANYSDVMEIMGWSSIQTAVSYVQSKREEDLQSLVDRAFPKS